MSEGRKDDQEKIRLDLIPSSAIIALGRVLTFGAKKYDDNNWRKGMKWGRLIGATLRHLFAWMGGQDKDPETGYSHLWHALCCIAFLIEYEQYGIGEDDRYKGDNNE